MDLNSKLSELGFKLNGEGDFELKGSHQTFIARISEEHSSRAFIRLAKHHPDVDTRTNSERKGLNFISPIKDCVSQGSIERALIKYDQPEETFSYSIGGARLKEA